jgi:hypothetical protein
MAVDFYYKFNGTEIVLMPQTVKAYKWIKKNINIEENQNPDLICIELRYFEVIGDDIIHDGLTIEKKD